MRPLASNTCDIPILRPSNPTGMANTPHRGGPTGPPARIFMEASILGTAKGAGSRSAGKVRRDLLPTHLLNSRERHRSRDGHVAGAEALGVARLRGEG